MKIKLISFWKSSILKVEVGCVCDLDEIPCTHALGFICGLHLNPYYMFLSTIWLVNCPPLYNGSIPPTSKHSDSSSIEIDVDLLYPIIKLQVGKGHEKKRIP